MEIMPYKSFGPLKFDNTTRDECAQLLGQPLQRRTNREGVAELHYNQFIVRFDPATLSVRECTLLPHINAIIDGIKVTWDESFLRRICERDGSPMEVYGFIVLPLLGIAMTGIHDNDDSQLAITAFSKNELDEWLTNSVPYVFSLG